VITIRDHQPERGGKGGLAMEEEAMSTISTSD